MDIFDLVLHVLFDFIFGGIARFYYKTPVSPRKFFCGMLDTYQSSRQGDGSQFPLIIHISVKHYPFAPGFYGDLGVSTTLCGYKTLLRYIFRE